ncbi:hypothetical protein F8M41_019142 [Gigaspora margarita]|uniref:Uncharacterized protein n=1 Tax=Gigaspora margarita TaxID=4874 RepID=A0A8H4EKS3_GIGMA|nr:hypothetical protein F8M41_019142 [Gigaspora margarita]
MYCYDIKPRYKILKELLDKYKTSSKYIYQIWKGEEAKRVLWDQPIPFLYNTQDSQAQSNIFSHGISQLLAKITTSDNNSSSINNINYSKILSNKSVKVVEPKIQNSHLIKKSVSSDNTFRRKVDLEKLMKDTERLAPICLSLPQ